MMQRNISKININILKIIVAFFAIITGICAWSFVSYANGNAKVTVTGTEGTVGDTVSISIKVSTDMDGMAQLSIKYNTEMLEYISGGANSGDTGLVVDILDDIKAGTESETVFKFKLKKSGETAITVGENTVVYPINAQDDSPMALTKENGNVKINELQSVANDNRLSGLTVQAVNAGGNVSDISLTPSFSADVTEYKVNAKADTVNLVVTTTLADPLASAKISGTKMDPGNNKTTITVTAQDGSQKQYIIYTVVGDTETQQETTSSTTTSKVTDRTPKEAGEVGKYIIQDFSLVKIPSGFSESTATYKDSTVAVLKKDGSDLTLICLANDSQGTAADLYIYNEETGAIDKMIEIETGGARYIIIPTDSTYTGPEGYVETTLTIGDDTVRCWGRSESSDFVIVYAMNESGNKQLYVYDKIENTMQRYMEGSKSSDDVAQPIDDNEQYKNLKNEYDTLKKQYREDNDNKNRLISIFGFALILILVVLFIMLRNTKKELEDKKFLSNFSQIKRDSYYAPRVESNAKAGPKKEQKLENEEAYVNAVTEEEIIKKIRKELNEDEEIEFLDN